MALNAICNNVSVCHLQQCSKLPDATVWQYQRIEYATAMNFPHLRFRGDTADNYDFARKTNPQLANVYTRVLT